MYDLIVVGSGPAGAMTAEVAAEKGLKVLLLDRQKFPRYKPCGGGFGTKVFDLIPEKEIQELPSARKNCGLHIVSPSLEHEALERRENCGVGYFISRIHFDNYLKKKAVAAGARFSKQRVIDANYVKNGVKVITSKRAYEGQMLVIANGVYSKLPASFELKKPYNSKTIGLTVNSETRISNKIIDKALGEKRLTTIFFGPVARGYGWVFPMNNRLNIGVGCTFKYFKNPTKVYHEFVQTVKDYFGFPELKLDPPRGYVVPFHAPTKKSYTDRVLLAGDAGWMVSGLSAEGICYALKSGLFAAETAVEAVTQGETSEAFLKTYQERWMDDFGKDLAKHALRMNQILYKNNARMELVVKMAKNDRKVMELMTDTISGAIPYKEAMSKLIKRGVFALPKAL